MSDDHDLDDRDTPDHGYPVQPEPRRRVRSNPAGVPVYPIVGRDSARELPVLPAGDHPYRTPGRARSRAETDELEVDAELERAFDALLRRRLRPYKWILGLIASTALGAGGAAITGALDGARQSERQLVRIEVLERDVGRLSAPLVPSVLRRAEPVLAPSATTAASPTVTPPKGTP